MSAHSRARQWAPRDFQAASNLPFELVDCFTAHQPVVVSALTLLSQLL
jgi:hypothetical protein